MSKNKHRYIVALNDEEDAVFQKKLKDKELSGITELIRKFIGMKATREFPKPKCVPTDKCVPTPVTPKPQFTTLSPTKPKWYPYYLAYPHTNWNSSDVMKLDKRLTEIFPDERDWRNIDDDELQDLLQVLEDKGLVTYT